MDLLLYSADNPTAVRRLKAVIQSVAPGHKVTVLRTLQGFARSLHRPRKLLRLAVLRAASKSELESLLVLRDLLSDLKIVLILPDHDEATVSLAHQLRPRLLWFADAEREDFRTVLTNMIKLYGNGSHKWD